MNYDPLEESLRLIRDGAPDELVRLTRRRRWLPIAADVDGDVAVTSFLRRGVSGAAWRDDHVLEHRDGGWRLLGGGGGDGYAPELLDRPSAAQLGGLVRVDGSGWTLRNPDRLLPWGARGISTASLSLAAEVGGLRVGERRLTAPRHGLTSVVWASRRPPSVVALDHEGDELVAVDLRRVRHRP